MTIEIKNFGPIDYLAFDLEKDLHLIYGQNAIGKSYATYVIYCLLKNIDEWQENRLTNTSYKAISDVIQRKLDASKPDSITDITDIVFDYIENQLFSSFCSAFQKSLLNSFFSLKNLNNAYTHKNFEIKILNSNNMGFNFSLNSKENLQLKYIANYNKIGIKKDLVFIDEKQAVQNRQQLGILISMYPSNLLYSFVSEIKGISYLPASRSGLYQGLNSFSPIIAELSQHRHLLKNSTIELPTLPEPLADFFKDISTVDKNYVNKEFSEAIEKIEQKILQGKIDYNEETRKITFQPNNTKLELNLSQASSMVAEVAPMIIYFKHIIGGKQKYKQSLTSVLRVEKPEIIFIEEPEAHLHPEVQVALLEIFVALSKLGLKIFITSHSNYMFNKLNNLVLANEVDREKIAIYHLVRGENGSIQNMDMLVTEDGINDDNFQATSEKLYEERMKIYENIHD
jgi:predicted ATPase